MSSSYVWFQLYYNGKDDPEGNPTYIKTASLDPPIIGALAKAVKMELKPKIDYAPVSDIFAYSPGTTPPFSQADSIRPGKKLADLKDTSDDHPLIVVAPAPAPQGKQYEPEGQVFKIKPAPEDVADLTEAVKTKRGKSLEHCDAADLSVYQPRTDFSQADSIRPGKKLAELIRELKDASDDHPLIVVAPAPAPQESDTQSQLQQQSEEKLNFVYDYVVEKKEEEATVVLSKPKITKYQRAVRNIGVAIDAPIWENSTLEDEFNRLGSAMALFSWGPGKEDCLENRRLYLAYLRNVQNIGLPPESKLFDGTEDSELLSTTFESFGVKTKGNIDVVLAHERHQGIATIRHNIWAGIELKKQDNRSDSEIRRQVVLQHLSASYLNGDTGILTIMTDLGPRWHFYWFSKRMDRLMAYQAQSKGEANYLIRHMMGSSDSASASTSVPTDFLNRASWNLMFPQREDDAFMEEAEEVEDPNEGGGQDSNGTSGSSKKRGPPGGGAQQKCQSTAAGGNNVVAGSANFMASSLDFMDEEEEREARFRDVLECMLPQLGVFPHRKLGHDHYTEGPPNHIGVS